MKKIRVELGICLLFAVNIGLLILNIASKILQKNYAEAVTDLLLIAISIYFIHEFYLKIKRRYELTEQENHVQDLLLDCRKLENDTLKTIVDDYSNLVSEYKASTKLKLNIVCENEKYIPTYANDTDACMDLKVKIKEPDCKFIKPNETQVFSTGVKASIPEGYMMLIFPRSSTGFKLNCMLSNTTGIVDAGYRDEIKLAITNFGKETVCLNDAQRVAQFVVIPRPQVELNLVEDNEDFREGDRKGGIGSTGEY